MVRSSKSTGSSQQPAAAKGLPQRQLIDRGVAQTVRHRHPHHGHEFVVDAARGNRVCHTTSGAAARSDAVSDRSYPPVSPSAIRYATAAVKRCPRLALRLIDDN
jgi:hypothetical protein